MVVGLAHLPETAVGGEKKGTGDGGGFQVLKLTVVKVTPQDNQTIAENTEQGFFPHQGHQKDPRP